MASPERSPASDGAPASPRASPRAREGADVAGAPARAREGIIENASVDIDGARARDGAHASASDARGSEQTMMMNESASTSAETSGVKRAPGAFAIAVNALAAEEARIQTERRKAWETLARDARERCATGTMRDVWLRHRLQQITSRRESERACVLSDFLPDDEETCAVDGVDGVRRGLMHSELRELIARVTEKDFPQWGVRQYGSRIGVIVPNGPELMTSLLCVLQHHTAVPINPITTQEEIEAELRNTNAKVLIYQRDGGKGDVKMRRVAKKLALIPLIITPSTTVAGEFTLVGDPYTMTTEEDATDAELMDESRLGLILHTSGSTGKKKIVPITMSQVLIGAAAIAASCKLDKKDVCCNFMPLFHVGGILRNVIAPIISGGTTVAMPFFDVDNFWEVLAAKKCTWYYGAPTMHMIIVKSAETMAKDAKGRVKSSIRFVANAAGPLQPQTAIDLRRLFDNATVLPSYGMTECMPIACPPSNYGLERPGTSGRSIGPEIGIFGADGGVVASGTVGNIMVRGPLVMSGYEGEHGVDTFGFAPGGWFNTGDMGWMDTDGFLFVTGRSKEVINRGGEIISPVEVEEALSNHPGVAECVAISVPHDTLQEVVGIVLVAKSGVQVPGLRHLVQHVSKRLPPSKWPQALIIVNSIPKSITGKVSRSAIMRDLRLPELEDGMRELQCTFQADLSQPGNCQVMPVKDGAEQVVQALLRVPGVNDAGTWTDNTGSIVAVITPKTLDSASVLEHATRYLPGYLEPKEILPVQTVPRNADGTIDVSKVQDMLRQDMTDGPSNPDQELLAHLWGEVLGTDSSMISIKDDFFLNGGSSIAAGQLAGLIRQKFSVNITGADMFELRTISRISHMIEKRKSDKSGDADSKNKVPPRPVGPVDWVTPRRSNGFFASTVQLLPLYFIQPFYNMMRWVLFLMCWSHVFHYLGPSLHWMRREHFMANSQQWGVHAAHSHFYSTVQLLSFFFAIFLVALIVSLFFPLSAIVFKWVCLGRLQAGSYPLWGQYYLRWWLVEQVTNIAGYGIFEISPYMFTWYMRLMGASVGNNSYVSSKAIIGDFDLITIERNTTIDEGANIRAFEARRGGMRLSPIFIGEGCTLCVHAIVGPGGYVPAGSTLAAFTSWREMDPSQVKPVSTKTAQMHSESPCLSSRLMVAFPIILMCQFVRWIPWIMVLRVVQQHSIGDNLLTHAGMQNWREELDTLDNEYDALEVFVTLLGRLSWQDCIVWFMDPFRLGCIALARLAHATLGPFMQLGAVILVKRVIVGKFKSGGLPQNPTAREWELTRRYIMRKLAPDGKFHGATDLLGKHYKYTSYIYRALGATVGERIFWPGSGVTVGDGMYDLLHIEDDVVWGSRSAVYPADTIGALPIRIRRGANISDRCVIFGGVTVMPNACLGSGSVAARKMTIQSGSIWVGSRNGVAVQLDPGGASSMADGRSSAKPFGRATYLGEATYPVIPWWFMPVICISVRLFKSASHMIPIYASWYATAFITKTYMDVEWQTLSAETYLPILFVVFLALKAVHTTLILGTSIALKWAVVGKRAPGNYPWDKSSYCFRWKLCDILSDTSDLMLLAGSEHLCRYFRLKGSKIGANVCLYPTGADPPMPEPDLVTIGDGACINFAHVIAHTNTLGAFALNNIVIRERATLCMESRVMGGTSVGADSILLEHTLAMVGDDVERGGIWQGWPVQMVMQAKASDTPIKQRPEKSYGAL